jgi:cytochrome c oxidase subunit 3
MNLGVRDGTYQTLFYAVTGTFLVLMIIGVVFSLVTVFRYLGGRTKDREIVTAHAIYWYFVGAAYVALWFAVYVTK